MTWALVSVLGLLAGVISGLFGVGGAVVIIPGLVFITKMPQHTAHGTSLAALLLPVGLLGVLEYSKRQQPDGDDGRVRPVDLLSLRVLEATADQLGVRGRRRRRAADRR